MKSIHALILSLLLIGSVFTHTALSASRDPFDYVSGNTAHSKPVQPSSERNVALTNDPNTLYLKLEHLPMDITLKNLKQHFPEVRFMADPQEEYLLASGTPAQLKQVQKGLQVLDRPLPQIEIEAQIIEISESALQNLGVTWKSLEQGFAASTAVDMLEKINFLIANGQAQIKARPRLATLVHKTALVRIGDRIPYSVPIVSSSGVMRYGIEYLDAGILLKILPTLSQKNLITIQINARIATLKEWKTTQAGEYPIIASRESDTQLHVKNGETLMLAGLLNEEERQFYSKLPILGDIPLLGSLFKNTSSETQKTDVLFLITPRVIQ
jgi:type II secretory pathway component GspD/PulD (secretin)